MGETKSRKCMHACMHGMIQIESVCVPAIGKHQGSTEIQGGRDETRAEIGEEEEMKIEKGSEREKEEEMRQLEESRQQPATGLRSPLSEDDA